MRVRLLRTLWLLAQGALAVWFLLSTAVDRQFIFFGVLALSFPAGLLVYGAAPVGIAMEELFHLDLWALWNALIGHFPDERGPSAFRASNIVFVASAASDFCLSIGLTAAAEPGGGCPRAA